MTADIHLIDSLGSLHFEAEFIEQGRIRMGVSKGIRGPGDPTDDPEGLQHKVHANRKLLDDVIIVADGFVALDPPGIGYLQLSVANELPELLFFGLIHPGIPVLEEDRFGHEISPVGGIIRRKGLEHPVVHEFAVPLVHLVQRSTVLEIDIRQLLELGDPESLQVRMEAQQQFYVAGWVPSQVG